MFNPSDFIAVIFWILLISIAVYLFYKSYKENEEEKENFYEKGLRAILDGEKRKAIEFLKEAIRQDSSNVDAYVRLGNILREEGALNQAIRVHKDLTLRADLNSEEELAVYKSVAKDLIAVRKDENASGFLKALLKLKADDTYAIQELIRIYENEENYAAAFELLRSTKKSIIDDQKDRLAMYKILEGLKRIDKNKEKEGRIAFKEALKINAKCEAAYILLGDSYLREDRIDDAIEKWQDCAKEIPEKAHFVFDRLEKAWFEKGEFFKLEEFYRSIVDKKKQNEHAVIALAEIIAKKGENQEAITICKSYGKENPNNQLVDAYLIFLLLKSKQQKNANEEMKDFLSNRFLKKIDRYSCSQCGNSEDEPLAKCRACGSWGKYQ